MRGAQGTIFVCLALMTPTEPPLCIWDDWSLGRASFLNHSSDYEQSDYGGSVKGSTWPQQHGFPFTMAILTTVTAEYPDFQQQKPILCTQNGPLLREIRQPTTYAVKLYNFCCSLG